MFRLIIVSVIAALLAGLFTNEASARGRSFPIEVTGTIIAFNPATHVFTIQVDEPAHVLTIAVGRYCKFKQGGATTSEQIIKPRARAKVSYFATIFTGNIAVEVELNPTPKFATGIIERVNVSDRRFVLSAGPNAHHLVLRWAPNARFIKTGKPSSAAALRADSIARVAYYAPSFASKYAVRIDFK
jgi:hypothetical protein